MTHTMFPQIPDQRGLATTAQLRAHGWSSSALSHLVATSGQRVLPTVYLPHRLTIDVDDRVVAGWLWAGPSTVLTGTHALARYGIDVGSPRPITRFLTGRDARNREGCHGMELRRTRRMPQAVVRDSVPVVPVERALVDAARYKEAPARDLTGWAISVLQRRMTSPDRLDAEITASGWVNLGALSAGCAAFRRGAWSRPEAAVWRLVEDAEDLPYMFANPQLLDAGGRLIGVPDGYFADEGVVVQVHSRQFHDGLAPDGTDQWASTVESDTRFARHGLVVVGVTPATLTERPDRFVASLSATLAANHGRAPRGVHIANAPGLGDMPE